MFDDPEFYARAHSHPLLMNVRRAPTLAEVNRVDSVYLNLSAMEVGRREVFYTAYPQPDGRYGVFGVSMRASGMLTHRLPAFSFDAVFDDGVRPLFARGSNTYTFSLLRSVQGIILLLYLHPDIRQMVDAPLKLDDFADISAWLRIWSNPQADLDVSIVLGGGPGRV